MGVNSAEKSLDPTAFVASWMVAVEVENNVEDNDEDINCKRFSTSLQSLF